MKRNPINIFIAFITAIILLTTLFFDGQASSVNKPVAQNGVMDLSQWNIDKNGPLDLKGEWIFYPYLLLKPDEIANANPERALKVKLPMTTDSFTKIEPELSRKLYGTLVMKVVLPKAEGKVYGIHSNLMLAAYDLYVNAKHQVGSGKVSSHERYYEGQIKVTDSYFSSQGNTAEIVYQVADYDIGDTTMIAPIFGTSEQIGRISKLGNARDLFLFGMLFVIGIYHLGIYAMRPKDRSPLYFAMFCIAFAMRMLLVGERFLTQLMTLDLMFHVKICYILICIGTTGLFGFLASTFKTQFKPWYFRSVLVVNALTLLLIAGLPYLKFSKWFDFYIVYSLLLIGYAILRLIFAVKERVDYAGLVLTGIVAIGIAGVNDAIYEMTVSNRGSMIPVGIFLFVMTQSFVLSLKFSKSFSHAEHLGEENERIMAELVEMNRTLEERVEARTKDLQNAMENLNFMSKTDYLTKLPNRLHIFDYIQELIEQQRRFYVAIADIDEFKLINDTFGHDIGDKILIRVAQKLSEKMEVKGLAGRWGGEEFIMVMRIDDDSEAFEFTESVRHSVASIKHKELDRGRRVTMTFGLCAYDEFLDIDKCLEFADQALYQGKKTGRNKTVMHVVNTNIDIV